MQRRNVQEERKKRPWTRTEVPGERLRQAERAIARNAVISAETLTQDASNKMTVGATLRAKFSLPSKAADQAGQAAQRVKHVWRGTKG